MRDVASALFIENFSFAKLIQCRTKFSQKKKSCEKLHPVIFTSISPEFALQALRSSCQLLRQPSLLLFS